MLKMCRLAAWLCYHLGFLPKGAWGSDWYALHWYSNFDEKHAISLAEEWYPEVSDG